MGKVTGIIAIKGGVGKTTSTSNIGTILSKSYNQKILLVDANFTAPNLGLHLGIIELENTIHDVLARRCSIKDAIIKTEFGFDFIGGRLNGEAKVNYMDLKYHIDKIKDSYDMVLLDSSPNLNKEIVATMIAADELFVVSTPDYPTLTSTINAVNIAKRRETPIHGIILNRVYNKKFELSLGEIEEAAHTPVLAVIPHDIKVVESLSFTRPAALQTPVSEAITEYKKLAAAMIGEEYTDPRFTERLKKYLRKDPRKQDVNRTVFRQARY